MGNFGWGRGILVWLKCYKSNVPEMIMNIC
jgi:hypothetical protein